MSDNSGLTFRDLRNAILFAAFVFLIIVFIRDIADVVLLFAIIALLVITLDPIVTWLSYHKIPRWLGTLMLVFTFIGLVILMMSFVVPIAIAQITSLVKATPLLIDKVNSWVNKFPTLARFTQHLDLSTIWRLFSPYVSGISAFTTGIAYLLTAAVAIFITTVYSLINPKPLADGLLSIFNAQYEPRILRASERLAIQIRAWAHGTIYAMIIIFVLSYIALLLIGIKQAFLFAIIAGTLEIIPVLGPILGGILPTIVALSINPILALWVVGSFTFIQQFENHILIPMVMSKQVSLHPVTVIIAVFVMGALYGIIGVFLATPVAVTVGVLYDELYLCEYRKKCDEAGIEPTEEDKAKREAEEHQEEAKQDNSKGT